MWASTANTQGPEGEDERRRPPTPPLTNRARARPRVSSRGHRPELGAECELRVLGEHTLGVAGLRELEVEPAFRQHLIVDEEVDRVVLDVDADQVAFGDQYQRN